MSESNLAVLLDVAEQARRFIERYADVVDGAYGVPEPNEAMQLSSALEEALAAYD